MAAFWAALSGGRILDSETARLMTTPTSDRGQTNGRFGYGLGVWLEASGDGLVAEGYDAGVSFRSVHRPATAMTWTVASNWTDGAWPVANTLYDCFPLT